MGSSSTKRILGLLVVAAYLFSFLAGAGTALQQTDETAAVTPAGQTSGSNLKVYGPVRWDFTDSSGTAASSVAVEDNSENPGNTGSPYYDEVTLQPAYQQSSDDVVKNTLTGLSFKYHPTYWLSDSLAVQPGSSGGLFDKGDSGELDYDFIFDEAVDSGLDDDQGEDAIDLLTPDDNIPDFADRNNDTTEGEDIYFPAIQTEYTWVQYGSSGDSQEAWDAGDDDNIAFPTGGLGGTPGLTTSDHKVKFDAVSDGDYVRLQTDGISISKGESVQFLDFRVTLTGSEEKTGGTDTATFKVEWLGDYDNPKTAEDNIVLEEDQIVTAERTDVSSPADTCSDDKPDDSGNKIWYVCASTVNAGNDNFKVELGRVLADRDETDGSNDQAATMLVNGAFYSVSEIAYGDSDDDIDSLTIQQAAPLGHDVSFDSIGVSLKGTSSGSAIPVLPPFNGQHDAVEDFGLAADTNDEGYVEDEDGSAAIDEIELDEQGIEDRTTSKSAVSLKWHARAQETGLLTNREDPLFSGTCESGASAPCWDSDINNVYPSHYVEVTTGSKAIVDSALFTEITGLDLFLWEPGADNSLHFGSSVRVFSQDYGDSGGGQLQLNPVTVTDTETRAGGENADPVTQLDLTYDALHKYADEDGDTSLDLDAISDEDTDLEDADSDDETADTDTDNLFDASTANDDDSEGDKYAPSVLADYQYYFLDRGTNDPIEAAVTAGLDTGTTDSNTQIRLSVVSDGDGSGLDSADINGDGNPDETIVESWDSTSDLLRLQSEVINVDVGSDATFLDHAVTVESTNANPGSGSPRAKLTISQLRTGDGAEIQSDITVDEGEFWGVNYDEDTQTSDDGASPQGSIESPSADDGDDHDWFVRVDSVSSGSVKLTVGRFLETLDTTDGDFEEILVDQNLYSLESVSFSGGNLRSFTLQHPQPIGSAITLDQAGTELTSVSTGSSLPLLSPFNKQHRVLGSNGPKLEAGQYGFFDSGLESDGDATKESLSSRRISAPALDLTVSAVDRLNRQTFIWHDSVANEQKVNGMFVGFDSLVTSHAGGFPDSGDQQPDSHTGNDLSTGTYENELTNSQHGVLAYVAFEVPSGHGQNLLEPGAMTSDTDGLGAGTVNNVVTWDDIDDGATGPDVTQETTAADSNPGFLFESSADVLDFFLGDGTVPAGQQLSPQEKAEQGITGPTAHFTFSNLNCSPSTVTAGNVVTCEVTATNDGEAAGSTDVILKKGGTTVDSLNTGEVDAGSSTTVALSWTASGNGTVTLSVASLSATVTVQEGDGPTGQANVGVQSCSVGQNKVDFGGSVSASVTFKNTGKAAGSGTFNVAVGGSNVASVSSGTLSAGQTKTVTQQVTLGSGTVDVSKPDAGQSNSKDVQVSVGGTNCGTVTVTREGPSRPTIPGFSTVALVAAAGAALVLLKRRD